MTHRLRVEDLSFVDRAPLRNEVAVEVRATPAEVWPALAEASAWSEWFAAVHEAHVTSLPPHGVGSTRHVEVAKLVVEERVLVCDEAARYGFVVLEMNKAGIDAMVELVTLTPTTSGTEVRYRQCLELSWWARPLTPLLRRQLRAELTEGLAGLEGWLGVAAT